MTEPGHFSCTLLVLAAGASTRMGRPKQLLPIEGIPLLRRIVQEALAAPVQRVIVVLGANADVILPALAWLPVEVVINAAWAEGMGSSVRAAMRALRDPLPDAVMIALADQPGFSRTHVARLIALQQETGSDLVASIADDVRMPPALFTRGQFPKLRELQGDQGARHLLRSHPVDFPVLAWSSADLDSPADYERYLRDNPPD